MATKAVIVGPDGSLKGDPIKGSSLVRTFCAGCNEPMRCSVGELGNDLLCESCGPPADEFIDLGEVISECSGRRKEVKIRRKY